MRLCRFDAGAGPRPGVLRADGAAVIDLAAEFAGMQPIIAGGAAALERVRAVVEAAREALPLESVRLLAPVERPGKFLAIGMNYRKHAEEVARHGLVAGPCQLWFNKQVTCLNGPYDDVVIPSVSAEVDYEAELGVVIGTAARKVSAAEALAHVFGYVVVNDVSARDWQRHSPTFTMGKSFDTHGPVGPCIVTADEVPDPQELAVRCRVNDELRQSSSTAQMIAPVAEQIAYLSTAFTLEPGDLLATGTPEGVGMACDPPRYLRPGDVVRCEVEGIGFIENRFVGEGPE